MKKIIIGLIILLVIVGGYYVWKGDLISDETMEVQVYFGKSGDIDRECFCDYPVTRVIPETKSVARAAIEELIKGPIQEEKVDGYFPCLPSVEMIRSYKEYMKGQGINMRDSIEINSLYVDNNVAYIDFSEEINAYGGGSCAAASIENGVTKTLKQFSTIDDVVISVEGETEYILQP